MIKKPLVLRIIAFLGITAQAQQINGRWTIFPVSSDRFSQLIETPHKVYTLAGNALSAYSLDDNESIVYNTSNGLSENGKIAGLYYNFDRNYLLIAYESANIDILYDNGKVVNMPDIRDAVITGNRSINNVVFSEGKIYVATGFGFVIFNDDTHSVKESGIFDTNVLNALHIADHLVIQYYKGNTPYTHYAPDDVRHSTLDKFKTGTQIWKNGKIIQLAPDKIAFRNNSNGISCWKFTDISKFEYSGIDTKTYNVAAEAIPTAGGLLAYSDVYVWFIDADGTSTYTPIPAALKGATFLGGNNIKGIWAELDGELAKYDISGDTPKKLMTLDTPEGTTVDIPVFMHWNKAGTKLYLSNHTMNSYYENPGDNWYDASYVDLFEGGNFYDRGVKDAKRYNKYDGFVHNAATGRLSSSLGFAIDPEDDDILYFASNGMGVLMTKGNDIIGISNKYNNPTPEYWWMNRTLDVNIDSEGNLWMVVGYNADLNTPTIGILPAAKRRKLEECTADDWIAITHNKFINNPEISFSREARSLFCKHSNMKFWNIGNQEAGFAAYDDNGTPLNINDDKCAHYQSVTDTEGNTIKLNFSYCMDEDQNGAVWFGCDRGVYYIANPKEAVNSATLRVKRPIVPRNDGTNFGDYLLESESVYSIAVDHSNRKWLGTYSSGVYLVSADGTRILAHYDMLNSPLPSNSIFAISCDPLSNKVYFGTPGGLACFDSDSAPAADSYSDVYAYPNPVRPEYTGWITITGLMDDSLVKIADMAGNVFFSGRSEGGMISWDGCDAAGNRVRSGVYLVFASQNATGSNSGVVTKIMVVN